MGWNDWPEKYRHIPKKRQRILDQIKITDIPFDKERIDKYLELLFEHRHLLSLGDNKK